MSDDLFKAHRHLLDLMGQEMSGSMSSGAMAPVVVIPHSPPPCLLHDRPVPRINPEDLLRYISPLVVLHDTLEDAPTKPFKLSGGTTFDLDSIISKITAELDSKPAPTNFFVITDGEPVEDDESPKS